MNFQTLENIRLYVGQKARKDRIAAYNSRLNKYSEIAAELENEVVFAEQILKDLAGEKTSG